MSDEHRYDVCGFAQNTVVRTPNLDRLAEGAVIFDNAYTPSPVCIPARQCMAEKERIRVNVVHIPTLKPLNEKAVKAFAEGKKGVVVCEEASIRGGLNMLVSYILRGTAVPIESVAVMDEFGQSASSHEELLEYYGLDALNVLMKIRKAAGK